MTITGSPGQFSRTGAYTRACHGPRPFKSRAISCYHHAFRYASPPRVLPSLPWRENRARPATLRQHRSGHIFISARAAYRPA